METEKTPLPSSDGDDIWDKIEADETAVTISQSELQELEEFLGGLRQIVLSHERRITNIENFLLAAMKGEDEVDSSEGERTDQSGEDGNQDTTIVDGSGNPLDTGGTKVPEDRS